MLAALLEQAWFRYLSQRSVSAISQGGGMQSETLAVQIPCGLFMEFKSVHEKSASIFSSCSGRPLCFGALGLGGTAAVANRSSSRIPKCPRIEYTDCEQESSFARLGALTLLGVSAVCPGPRLKGSLFIHKALSWMDVPASDSTLSFTTARTCSDEELRGSICSSAISRLQKVHNVRDFAEALPRSIKPGRLFRSGSPAGATEEDALILRRDLGIQCFVDFRSAAEHKEDTSWPHVLSDGIIRTYNDSGTVTEHSVERFPGLVADGEDPLPPAELHRLSLLERGKFIRGLLPRLPYWAVAAAAWYKLIGDEQGMRGAIVPILNEGGLLLIYEILLETSGAEISRVLNILLDAAQTNKPSLIFCKLGKDRTGTVAALVVAACGATREEIVADYIRSDGQHEIALGGIEKMEDVQGMDPHLFERAPPEAMHALIDYAEAKYGGLQGYLTKIGFGPDKQEALRKALGETEWSEKE